MMNYPKIQLKLVRSFGVGFTIHSPTLNGLCFDIQVACFILAVWPRMKGNIFGFHNYWNG